METYQKLKKGWKDKYAVAEKYFSLISVLNDLKMTERETQLAAFTSIRGSISYATAREEFCKRYNTTFPTINNMMSRLKRIGILIKEEKKVKINPVFNIDFDIPVVLEIRMEHGNS